VSYVYEKIFNFHISNFLFPLKQIRRHLFEEFALKGSIFLLLL